MSVDLQTLSNDDVVRLTKVLARRPEYGISIPSKRWLNRQEERMKSLPKELLRPKNPLKRLAMKIADSIDPDILDTQAVMCPTHANLNGWLIRRLFLAVAYEATVHSDPIRSWEGRKSVPGLSAFVGRLDSIAALWIEPALFQECYGVAPFDPSMIYVRSGCEACILGAIGASGRALADLRAILVDRTERREDVRLHKGPRLTRIIEAWIDHLGARSENRNRPEECRAMSEDVLVDLRGTRAEVRAWRLEQKRANRRSRAARNSVYTELQRTKSGHRLSSIPSNARHKRRTRHGIPVALADRKGAEDQARAATLANHTGPEDLYRPDSLCDFSEVGRRQRGAYSIPPPRPDAPEPGRMSGSSAGHPTNSFIQQFEREQYDDEIQSPSCDYDDDEEDQYDERDYDQEERSRSIVSEWYTSRLADDALPDDRRNSIISRIHPAFQPSAGRESVYAAPSAVPAPLHYKKDRDPLNIRTEGLGGNPSANVSTTWTDATVYTVDPSTTDAASEAPPVPRMPLRFQNRGDVYQSPTVEEFPLTPSVAPGEYPTVSPIAGNADQSTIDFPSYADPFSDPQHGTSTSSGAPRASEPLNWPAPPQPQAQTFQGPSGMGKPQKKYLFQDSEVGSSLSTGQRQYLRNKREMKSFSRQENPFTRAGAGVGAGSRTGTPGTPTSSRGAGHLDRGYSRQSQRTAGEAPSLSSSRGDATTTTTTTATPAPMTPGPRASTAQEERDWWQGWGVRDDESEFDPVRPDDSASNVYWRRGSQGTEVTQMGMFVKKGKK
ncbi:hypothetical protein F5Y15DRAFT_139237 [Xylariaceae sp. FL0016]|nr:hypothetical protein F5Y15DRAFT_139237 [Xylariaceae sp. FL0016]